MAYCFLHRVQLQVLLLWGAIEVEKVVGQAAPVELVEPLEEVFVVEQVEPVERAGSVESLEGVVQFSLLDVQL